MSYPKQQDLYINTAAPILLPEQKDVKLVNVTSKESAGKILIREDTIVGKMPGCAACGRSVQLNCGPREQWSGLCWGKNFDKRYYCMLVLLSTVFVLSLSGTIFFLCTNSINNAILYGMVIRNQSVAYEMWKMPTVHPVMKVYVFNYTNLDRVKYGLDKKFKIEEIGPLEYSQTIERVNEEFNGDQLTYQEKNSFQYIPNREVAEFDQVYVPNLPMLGLSSLLYNTNRMISINPFLPPLNPPSFLFDHPEAFVKLPLHRFLWGYDDKIINMAKTLMIFNPKWNMDKFGLLVARNGTSTDKITINTGEKDINKINLVQKFNGKPYVGNWGNPECNSVEASEGTMFSQSLLDRKSKLKIFFPNFCRTLSFKYEKEVKTMDGVTTLRYKFPENIFDDPDHNPDNQCYCDIDSGVCPPKGVFNISTCAMGAPALISFPHFYRGDPHLRDKFEGLKPDPDRHDTYLDIHPTLGISINGKSSLQLNIQVKKVPMMQTLKFLPDNLILPVAWINMVVEDLPENVRSLIYHATYTKAALQLGLGVISVIFCILSAVYLIILYKRRKNRPCAVIKNVHVGYELSNALLNNKLNGTN